MRRTWCSATWTRPATPRSPAVPRLVVHAYPDGRAPGLDRLRRLGVEPVVVPAVGTSQDVAMLLAHEKGAELIVSVGAHFNLTEFLDKNRAGMSSTFLTRLRIGETLVDAKGVSRLYNPGVRGWQMWAFLGVALAADRDRRAELPGAREFFDLVWLKIKVALDREREARRLIWAGRERCCSSGLLGALSRGLARGRLRRLGGRHPDRRRLRLATSSRAPPRTSRQSLEADLNEARAEIEDLEAKLDRASVRRGGVAGDRRRSPARPRDRARRVG